MRLKTQEVPMGLIKIQGHHLTWELGGSTSTLIASTHILTQLRNVVSHFCCQMQEVPFLWPVSCAYKAMIQFHILLAMCNTFVESKAEVQYSHAID